MARNPSKVAGSRLSNMIGALRGQFDFKIKEESKGPVPYGSSKETITNQERSNILKGAYRTALQDTQRTDSLTAMMGIVKSSYDKVGNTRTENRKILQLMPEVSKAARLMVASILSPNDLTRHSIDVSFNYTGLEDDKKLALEKAATTFFQEKLNLKTQVAKWIYQFGYETGSAVFAVIPLRAFEKLQHDCYIGTEDFRDKVIEPLSKTSIFGFGDTATFKQDSTADIAGLESLSDKLLLSFDNDDKKKVFSSDRVPSGVSKKVIEAFIGSESLNLTDNFSILQANDDPKKKREKKHQDILRRELRKPQQQSVVSIEANQDGEENLGNPIFLRLPPESVTVIHTPGDPNDHQGYLVLLDQMGSPINAVTQAEADNYLANNTANQTNIFNQSYNAYGLTNGFGQRNVQTLTMLYNEIVASHLKNRLSKTGITQVSLGGTDSLFRCMFSRMLQKKQTRILFLPKDLVTYMTFEMDQEGYGVSRLEGIKFNLGMKMALQVSRVLAAIKAAMDKRKIEFTFDPNMMENPEQMYQHVIREYTNKSRISFAIDPTTVQSQIAEKSVSIKGNGIPGIEAFDISNEPDARTNSFDFDPDALKYIDDGITNGMRIPAATMNSLNEDEYARSVVTTNLFFAMDVSMDQDIVIKDVSDLIRKYGRHSEEFINKIYEIFPDLDPRKTKGSKSDPDDAGVVSTDKDKTELPKGLTIDTLINAMSITLPKPNVAPSKAQFEALEAMVSAITTTISGMLPDEMIGSDETLRATVPLLRAKFIADNIRKYLEGSGMTNLKTPGQNFSAEFAGLSDLMNGLGNIASLMEDKAKIRKPAESVPDAGTDVSGFQ